MDERVEFNTELVDYWRARLANRLLSDEEESYLLEQVVHGDSYERFVRDIESLDAELISDHALCRRQSYLAFTAALVLMSAGFILIMYSCLQSDGQAPGIVVGLVLEAVAALPFWLWSKSSDRLQDSAMRLDRHRIYMKLIYTAQSMPTQIRNKMKEEIVRKMLEHAY